MGKNSHDFDKAQKNSLAKGVLKSR